MYYKYITSTVLDNKRISHLMSVYEQKSKNLIKWMDPWWSICTPYFENCESIGPQLTQC